MLPPNSYQALGELYTSSKQAPDKLPIVALLLSIFAIFSQSYSLIRKAIFINFNQFFAHNQLGIFDPLFFNNFLENIVTVMWKEEDSL